MSVEIQTTWGCPMKRFFSQQNIERYRKLLDTSTDEPQRRLIFKLLAAQVHSMQMDANSGLRVRVERRGDKYTWELHRDGHFQPVKFSAPVYLSEEAARASGNEVRTVHLAHLASLAARRPRAKLGAPMENRNRKAGPPGHAAQPAHGAPSTRRA
jgi:hypothetical protein